MAAATPSPDSAINSESTMKIVDENLLTEIETEHPKQMESIRRQEADVLQEEVMKLYAELKELSVSHTNLRESSIKKYEAKMNQMNEMKKRVNNCLKNKKAQLQEKKTRQEALIKEKNSLLEKSKELETNMITDKKRLKDLQREIQQTERNLKDLVTENRDASKKSREDFNEFKYNARERHQKNKKSIESVKKNMKEIEMEVAKVRVVLKAIEHDLPSNDSDEENE